MSTPSPAPPFDPAASRPLARFLADAVGASDLGIISAALLTGGAVQDNWQLTVNVEGGPRAGRHDWVMRTNAASQLGISLDRASEYAVISAAHAGGVRVAEPIAQSRDAAVVGRPFMVQAKLPGSANARRLVRDPKLSEFGPSLARDLGRELAGIHAISAPRPDLAMLPIPLVPPGRAEVQRLRAALDRASEPRPALEYVLCWLDANAPASPRELVLVHGDFRTGNYMVDSGRLSGILDWEFAHWGDPREDLGWFCGRCWRAGNDVLTAGGIATRADLIAGYNDRARQKIDEGELAYWEILAAARWAAIAVLQGDRFRVAGDERIEPALTALMPSEMELDALDLIALAKSEGRS
jgi:aminoglycoside phosphotransferase (APT) family kinase protein